MNYKEKVSINMMIYYDHTSTIEMVKEMMKWRITCTRLIEKMPVKTIQPKKF